MKVKLFLVAVSILFGSIVKGQVQIGQTILLYGPGVPIKSLSFNNDGDVVAVAFPDFNNSQGLVMIFEFNGTDWVQKGDDLIGNSGSQFGFSMELDGTGNVVVIGTPMHASSEGKVQIFEFNGTTWDQRGMDLLSEIEEDNGRFGDAVAISEDGLRVAVGEPGCDEFGVNTDTGAISVFEFDGNQWQKIGQTIYGIANYSYLGMHVDLDADGNRFIVGSTNYSPNGIDYGYVQICESNEGGTWWSTIGTAFGSGNKYFGSGVAINDSGTIIAINAPGDDTNGLEAGLTSIFQYNGDSFELMGQEILGPGPDSLLNRLSLNGTGDILAIPPFSPNYETKIYRFQGPSWNELGNGLGEGNCAVLNNDGFRLAISTMQQVKIYDLTDLLEIIELDNKLDVILYPNPIRNIMHLSKTFTNLHFTIYNSSGRNINEGQVDNYIDMTPYASGMYMIKLSDGMDSSTFKVIKE